MITTVLVHEMWRQKIDADELARCSGVPSKDIARMIRQHRAETVEERLAVAKALNVPPKLLFEEFADER
jgi:plasmid maintenance system antidote protein VapI